MIDKWYHSETGALSPHCTTLNERRVHLCQVYVARQQNQNHPLHLNLPSWGKFSIHNYHLRSGANYRLRLICTKRTQDEHSENYKLNCMYVVHCDHCIAYYTFATSVFVYLLSLKAVAVPDPDLEIKGGQSSRTVNKERGAVSKIFFRPFGPQFSLKIRGTGPPGPSPG